MDKLSKLDRMGAWIAAASFAVFATVVSEGALAQATSIRDTKHNLGTTGSGTVHLTAGTDEVCVFCHTHELESGAVRLRIVKPCTRCVVTTTDQHTGESAGEEPVRTLRTYRWNAALRGVAFGQNAVVVAGAGQRLVVGQVFEALTAGSAASTR